MPRTYSKSPSRCCVHRTMAKARIKYTVGLNGSLAGIYSSFRKANRRKESLPQDGGNTISVYKITEDSDIGPNITNEIYTPDGGRE